MRNKAKEIFFQPVISALGLITSIITAVSPLFSRGFVKLFFLNEQLSSLAAYFSFIFGIIAIWMIIEHYRYFEIRIGKARDRGKGFPEPLVRINKKASILIMFVLDLIFAFGFLYIKFAYEMGKYGAVIGLIQVLLYVLFFIILMAIFALLTTSTYGRLAYQQRRDDFPWILYTTLEKNGLISSGIRIYENKFLSFPELTSLNIKGFPSARKFKLITTPQKEEIIEVIVTDDGEQLIRVLKKGSLEAKN